MVLSKVKFAAIILLVLSLAGSGAGFVARRGQAKQTPAKPAPAAAADKAKAKAAAAKPKAKTDKPTKTPEEMTALLKARAALARKGYEAAVSLLTQTKRFGNVISPIGKPEDVYTWSVRWLQAQLDMGPKHEDQVAALEAHLKRMTELKKTVVDLRERATPIQVDEAEWYRLEAELWLARAKAVK